MLKYLIAALSLFVNTACSIVDSSSSNNKVRVLSYYPNCEYIVLDILKVSSGKELNNVYSKTNSPLSMRISNAQGDQDEAILELKMKAEKVGANALAVISFKNDKKLISSRTENQAITLNNYYYTAQAIKLCDEETTQSIDIVKREPVKYLIDGTYNL